MIAGCTDPDESQFGISLFSTILGKHLLAIPVRFGCLFDLTSRKLSDAPLDFALDAAIIVFVCSMWLNFAITWTCFNETFRGLLTDYAVTISVFFVIILSYQWKVESGVVPRIVVPSDFDPTCRHDETHNTTILDVNYDCLCSSHQHCTFVNSEHSNGNTDGSESLFEDVNGTAYPRPWHTSYKVRCGPPEFYSATTRTL